MPSQVLLGRSSCYHGLLGASAQLPRGSTSIMALGSYLLNNEVSGPSGLSDHSSKTEAVHHCRRPPIRVGGCPLKDEHLKTRPEPQVLACRNAKQPGAM